MMKYAMACVLLVAVAAIPADYSVPETEFADYAVQLHKEASGDISTLLEAGKTKDACASLAETTSKEITDSVAASQKVMNAVPKGALCSKEGQQAVDSAKKQLDAAKKKEAAAKSAGNTAAKAPVKFADISISQVKANDCSAFHADPAYISAKKAADAAAKKQAEAGGQVKGAQGAYDNAVAAQKAAIQACACHTKWQHDQAKKAADKSNSAENAKAWSKAHMMKCVLAGTSASACKVPPTPKVTVPALEEPAKSVSGCNAPTPPPTMATLDYKQKKGGTSCRIERHEDLQFLDRLYAETWPYNTLLSGFQLRGDGQCYKKNGGDKYMNYVLMSSYTGPVTGAVNSQGIPTATSHTGCSDFNGKKIQYLDRQSVDCGAKAGIFGFGVTGGCSNANDRRYKFKCKSITGASGSRSTRHTSCQDADGKQIEYLDRQNVQCKKNEVLSSFKFTRSGCSGIKMRYEFKCIKLPHTV
jgi:hypothetical protein